LTHPPRPSFCFGISSLLCFILWIEWVFGAVFFVFYNPDTVDRDFVFSNFLRFPHPSSFRPSPDPVRFGFEFKRCSSPKGFLRTVFFRSLLSLLACCQHLCPNLRRVFEAFLTSLCVSSLVEMKFLRAVFFPPPRSSRLRSSSVDAAPYFAHCVGFPPLPSFSPKPRICPALVPLTRRVAMRRSPICCRTPPSPPPDDAPLSEQGETPFLFLLFEPLRPRFRPPTTLRQKQGSVG